MLVSPRAESAVERLMGTRSRELRPSRERLEPLAGSDEPGATRDRGEELTAIPAVIKRTPLHSESFYSPRKGAPGAPHTSPSFIYT